MKGNLKNIAVKLLPVFISLLLSCDTENQEVFNGIFSKKGDLATITTTPASFITGTSAVAGGNLTDNGKTYIISCGLCWGANENPDTTDFKILTRNVTGEFTDTITGLLKGTTYFLRAYVTNNIGISYGNQETFTTLNIPTITTTPVTSITDSSAMIGGEITADGGSPVLFRGICWSRSQNPTVTDSTVLNEGSGIGTFSRLFNRLLPNTTYYIKAYATNSIGTAYGNELAFTTTSPLVIPTISTTSVTGITQTTAKSGGNITSDGGSTVTARGICWSTSANPTIENSRTYDGTGTGAFTSTLSGLTSGTLYYVRAYATNSIGTEYGNEISFTSSSTGPTAFTYAATNVAISTATINGSVNANNLSTTVTFEYGITLSYGNSVTAIGSPVSGIVPVNVTSNIAGLTASTLYHFRVKAVNLAGTTFGKDSTFTTLTVATIPSLTTAAVSSVTQTTAVSGGNITSNGGATVTSSGICWGISPSPTIALTSKTTDGLATGAFAGSLTGLTANTIYYIRSYATNSVGTAYGNEISFTTLPAGSGTVTDIDGNVYNTVVIGTQTWMKENLKTTRYRDGTAIPNITDPATWIILNSGAYCWYNNNPATYKATYGALYNYYTAVDNRNVCPTGWHVPTNSEWTTLINYLGGSPTAGGNMKEIGLAHWVAPNHGATNSSGFTALPGGKSNCTAAGCYIYEAGHFWSSTENSTTTSWFNRLMFSSVTADLMTANKIDGYSIRCIQGEGLVLPAVTTTNLSSITQTTASGGGMVNSNGGSTITATGVCWSTFTNPTIALSTKTSDVPAAGVFISSITGLTANTTYYVRAYATNSFGTTYGNEQIFSTSAPSTFPTLSTTAISSITPYSATGGGNITSDGGTPVVTRGVCWNTAPAPTVNIFKSTDGSGIGSFVSNITTLAANTTYFVRAYATNSAGTAYGNELSFTTSSGATSVPSLTTSAAWSITQTNASSGGNITNNGGGTIIASGVCWSISANPTIVLATKTTDLPALGLIMSSITGLTPNTLYYVRAYATNSIGTGYGNEISFTTLPAGSGTVIDIDGNVYNTITIGTQTWMKENLKTTRYRDGTAIPNVTDNSAWSLLTTGSYCWWVNDQATYKATYGALYNYYAIDTKNLCPTGWHVPTDSEWTTLTTYLGGESIAGSKLKETGNTHWMSYNTDATNESGFTAIPGGYRVTDGSFMNLGAIGYWWASTEYSGSSSWGRFILHNNTLVSSNYFNKVSGFSVRCLQGEIAVLPSIMTTNPTVYNTSVSTGGNLLTTGGGTITDMGVCWSTSPDVTISSGSKSSAGTTALGVYTIPIPSLTPLTTYYIKAYATNSAGTGYGVEFSFTTGDGLPSVSTTSVSAISNASASTGGTITTLGNVSANTRGVCWSTTANPTIADSKTTDGSGAGIFTSSITGLSANTTYYVRAYATNSVGTKYGNEISFTTTGIVSDIDGNNYNTVKIGSQTWMKENLKTTKYRDGTSIPIVPDDAGWSSKTTDAFCWYNNDPATYNEIYGGLYNFFAITDYRNLCPTGWHVPTYNEWSSLVSYLGGESVAEGKLKSTSGWNSPNTGATNESGFTALAGGYRIQNGPFNGFGNYSIWWSSTENDKTNSYYMQLTYNNSNIPIGGSVPKQSGCYVRCLQGETAPLAIGDNYQGGKIAYIFQPGDNGYIAGQVHGLIAAPSDQSTGAEWGCNGTNLSGADSTGLGRGNQNTIDIVTGCATAGTAAKICSDLVLSGYSDWYLPSRDELNKLYLNQSAIGGFSTSVYWSSSEYNEFAASIVAFGPGGISNVFKYETHYVRAVRTF